MSEPELHPVISSNLEAVGYNAELRRLYVKFKGRQEVHTYDDVPPEVHRDLIGASSLGAFFHANVKGKYQLAPPRRHEDERRDE